MASEVLDRETLINEIWRNKGKVALVAERLGVTSKTVYNYADKYATVKNALDDSRMHFDELLVDTAEMKVQKAVMADEAWAIRYVLSTKGKARGYVERSEVTGADGDAIETKTNVSFDYSKLSTEQLKQLVTIAESVRAE